MYMLRVSPEVSMSTYVTQYVHKINGGALVPSQAKLCTLICTYVRMNFPPLFSVNTHFNFYIIHPYLRTYVLAHLRISTPSHIPHTATPTPHSHTHSHLHGLAEVPTLETRLKQECGVLHRSGGGALDRATWTSSRNSELQCNE